MKLYVWDGGWRGAIVIFADNKEAALKIAKEQTYNGSSFTEEDLTEVELINNTLVLECMGDT